MNEDKTFSPELSAAKLEQDISRPLDSVVPGTAARDPRPLVRLTRIAPRSLDPDNVCEKFVIDAMRRAGLITGDSQLEIRLQVEQMVATGAQETGTIIEIEWP